MRSFQKNVKIVVNSAELFDEVLGINNTFNSLICIGSHGHPTQPDGVLCHIWDVRAVEFNGKSLTETCLNAALAGYFKVPLVTVSGDEDSLKYITNNISPKIATAAVKKGIGKHSTVSLHPKKAQKLIKSALIDGLKHRNEISLFQFDNPIMVDITYNNQGGAFNNIFFIPGDERLAGDKVRFIAQNAKDTYYGCLARDKLSKQK